MSLPQRHSTITVWPQIFNLEHSVPMFIPKNCLFLGRRLYSEVVRKAEDTNLYSSWAADLHMVCRLPGRTFSCTGPWTYRPEGSLAGPLLAGRYNIEFLKPLGFPWLEKNRQENPLPIVPLSSRIENSTARDENWKPSLRKASKFFTFEPSHEKAGLHVFGTVRWDTQSHEKMARRLNRIHKKHLTTLHWWIMNRSVYLWTYLSWS